MQGDSVSRLLLAVIALGLLVLVGQGFGLGAPPPSAPPEPEAELGRYEVQVMRAVGGILILRSDTATGRVWRRRLSGNDPWIEIGAEGEAVLDPVVTPGIGRPRFKTEEAEPTEEEEQTEEQEQGSEESGGS